MIIRRRVRSASAQRGLRYKQTAPFSVGPSTDEIKESRHAARVAVIGLNRTAVFDRDRMCRRCGAPGRPDDHCHETRSRAMLRGRPPEEIFNLVNCMRLCPPCHERITRHEERIVMLDPVRGCNGDVRFEVRSKWSRA